MYNKAFQRTLNPSIGIVMIALCLSACVPAITQQTARKVIPPAFKSAGGTGNTAKINWRDFFNDPYLIALIDTALNNNQELMITLQEIQILKNEVRSRKGEYLPFVNVRAGVDIEKAGRYTHQGATDHATEVEPGMEIPDPLPDYLLGVFTSWELDIWHKLRNAKKSAVMKYLSSVEGKNFMITQLVAEIANSYYELLSLDNQLEILTSNIGIQESALRIVWLQKTAARATELAVKKFEAEVLKNQSRQYYIQQRIVEIGNRINFLLGRPPQPVEREARNFIEMFPDSIHAGIPSQLLENRPDVRQAELELTSAKLDVKVARAGFYPSLGISAGLGLRAFDPGYFLRTPESMLYSMGGELAAPLINRNAIKAAYYSANAKQLQAIYHYEQTLLNAYIEVANQLSNIENLQKSFDLKAKEVEALTESINISNNLFTSARADYMEVLLTQRDALDSRFELIETKKQQLNAMVDIYQALGGGWH